MKKFLLTASMLVACSTVQAKVAKCYIENDGVPVMNAKCEFKAKKGGSFSLSNLNRKKALFDDILIVDVSIVAKNVAEVRGLTRDGINSRWGEYHRSQTDKACWVDGSNKICAY